MKKHRIARSIGLGALMMLIGAGGMLAMNDQMTSVQDQVVPAANIIRLGENPDGIARIDSSTGAIHRFLGNPRSIDPEQAIGLSAWKLEHAGVGTRPVGALRLQQAGPATFLVDALSGETWILRMRNGHFGWDRVETIR